MTHIANGILCSTNSGTMGNLHMTRDLRLTNLSLYYQYYSSVYLLNHAYRFIFVALDCYVK